MMVSAAVKLEKLYFQLPASAQKNLANDPQKKALWLATEQAAMACKKAVEALQSLKAL
jgi:hypothetical protein